MQAQLNSVLLEGQLEHHTPHPSGPFLMMRLEHATHDAEDSVETFYLIMRGRLAEIAETLDDGTTVRVVGRLQGWTLITGAVINVEHLEIARRARTTDLAAATRGQRADVNGAE